MTVIYQGLILLNKMRRKLLVGNWKMNKTMAETTVFGHASIELLKKASEKQIDIGVTPPYLSLQTLVNINPRLIDRKSVV